MSHILWANVIGRKNLRADLAACGCLSFGCHYFWRRLLEVKAFVRLRCDALEFSVDYARKQLLLRSKRNLAGRLSCEACYRRALQYVRNCMDSDYIVSYAFGTLVYRGARLLSQFNFLSDFAFDWCVGFAHFFMLVILSILNC